MSDEPEKLFYKMVEEIKTHRSGQWISYGCNDVCLDGYFGSRSLRAIADALDAAMELDNKETVAAAPPGDNFEEFKSEPCW
jgi:hypothetical protein